jgi:DNA polymerase elongation subunit (family B)
MAAFYTNVQTFGSSIFYRGVTAKGKKIKERVEYSPSLYIPSTRDTGYTSLDGSFLQQKIFGNIREARDYVKKYGDVDGMKIYGNQQYEYAFIADQHSNMVDWDFDKVSIAIIDIEVGSENGFPDPYLANEPITAITISYVKGKTFVFGCGDYQVQGDEKYIQCKDEWTLCKNFLNVWNEYSPDVVTGWNTKFFDIPYLVNRFRKILGEPETKRLSPWGFINERKVVDRFKGNKELIAYTLLGISSLDYLELYKWFAPGGRSQESYRLDHIAYVELGDNKLSYEEYGNLHNLYKQNYQLFIEYNIKDVDLILRMDDKLKLLELALTLAYDTKSNYEDVFTQTRMWDSLSYSYLLKKKIIVPPKVPKDKDSRFEGAYVKEVQVGLHHWVSSFDLNSLYPHLLMQYNISPETLIEPEDYTPAMREIVMSGVDVERMLSKSVDTSKLTNATLTPNGQFFRTDIRGFLPQMMEEMYEDRKKFKKMALQSKQEYENETNPIRKAELIKLISRYDNLQLAKKLSLNSAYGALGSQYFRFYDLRMAVAVTLAGQLSIRWIENKLNAYMNKLLGTNNDYVIASDTDSIYLHLGSLVNKIVPTGMAVEKVIDVMDRICEDKIQPYIDRSYQELANYVHAYEQKMQMKREALANKGIWTGKKHYILNVFNNEGVQYKEPKLKVMGLEMVKSSTPTAIRDKMKEVISLLVNGTETDVQNFIEGFRTEFKTLPIEEISFPRGISNLNTYLDPVTLYRKSTPIHVKGAIIYNHYLKEYKLEKKYPFINEGEKLKYVYLKLPNHIKDFVISYPTQLPPEFGLDKYIDYDVQYDKTFLEPIKGILDCIGWKSEKTNSIEDFFS